MLETLIDDVSREVEQLTVGINARTRLVMLHKRTIETVLQALGNIGLSLVPKDTLEEPSPSAQYEFEEVVSSWVTPVGQMGEFDVPSAQILSDLRSRGWKLVPPS